MRREGGSGLGEEEEERRCGRREGEGQMEKLRERKCGSRGVSPWSAV